jgi:hypothetical protein
MFLRIDDGPTLIKDRPGPVIFLWARQGETRASCLLPPKGTSCIDNGNCVCSSISKQ